MGGQSFGEGQRRSIRKTAGFLVFPYAILAHPYNQRCFLAIAPSQHPGPYEILSAIAAGGMREVYRARDSRLDRTIAIKVLLDQLADRAELRDRFEREARTIAGLNHPQICTPYDVGRDNGRGWDLSTLPLTGDRKPQCLLQTPLAENQASLSPDGHWLAYTSDESGSYEIYVSRDPDT
jgi:serine/threonine protein kinase